MTQATYDDANLLLRLYELRRDPKMREARAWFVASFKPNANKRTFCRTARRMAMSAIASMIRPGCPIYRLLYTG